MALGADDAFFEVDLPSGADEGAGSAAGDVAGFADGGVHAEFAGFGEGNLDLVMVADRPENRELHGRAGQFAFGVFAGIVVAEHLDLVGRGELAGLRKHLLRGQLVAGPEENLQSFLGDVDVPGAGFDQDLVGFVHG